MKQASINTNRSELISTIAVLISFAFAMLCVSQNFIIALYGLGLLFRYLESIFLALKKDDARLSLIGFFISILMFLPLLTLIAFTTHIVFYGFFIFISIFYAVEKRIERRYLEIINYYC
jgi:hypothetical protein